MFPVRPVKNDLRKDETQRESHPFSVPAARHFLVAAGGVEDEPSALVSHLGEVHRTIAADGGLRLLNKLQMACHTLVGDFDTLAPEEVETARAKGSRVLRFPPDKSKSDLEIALDEARSGGATHVTIIGALGGEVDHCLANFLAPLSLCLESAIWARLVTSRAQIYLTQEPVELTAVGQRCSLQALSARVEGLSLSGFKYPLQEATFSRSQTLCLANEVTEARARVEFASGELYITLMHNLERPQP